jgi:hypothetical protein
VQVGDAEDLVWAPRASTPDYVITALWTIAAIVAGAVAAVVTAIVLPRPVTRSFGFVVFVVAIIPAVVVGWRFRPDVRSAVWPRIRAGSRGLSIIHGTNLFIPWDAIASVRGTRSCLATEVRNGGGDLLARFPLALGDVLRRTDGRTATLADLIVQEADGRLVADIRLGQATIRPRLPGEPRSPIDAQQDAAQRVAEQFLMVLILVAVISAIAVLALR